MANEEKSQIFEKTLIESYEQEHSEAAKVASIKF